MVARLSCLCSFHNGMSLALYRLSRSIDTHLKQPVFHRGYNVGEAAPYMLVEADSTIYHTVIRPQYLGYRIVRLHSRNLYVTRNITWKY